MPGLAGRPQITWGREQGNGGEALVATGIVAIVTGESIDSPVSRWTYSRALGLDALEDVFAIHVYCLGARIPSSLHCPDKRAR